MQTRTDELPDRAALRAAHERIRKHVHRTPLLSSRTLGERCGARVFLKCENLQRSGSFKIRGAVNSCLTARAAGAIGPGGVLTYSSGNHGQAVALSARVVDCRATIVVPEDIPRVKEDAIRGYGAELVRCGLTSVERHRRALEIQSESGALMIPPFDHPWIIAGQASVGLEILEEIPDLDVILTPVGGGGLIAGIALAAALDRSRPGPRVIGVEPESANSMKLSLEAGRIVTLARAPDTIADGLRPVAPGELTLRACQRHVDEVILVGDREIRAAQQLLLERAKLFVEPSGAAAAAALIAHPEKFAGLVVAVVLSGGNAGPPALA